MKYAWMREHVKVFPVALMCRVLGVSRSGYYGWLRRGPSRRATRRAQIAEAARRSHEKSNKVYGYRKVHDELVQDEGINPNTTLVEVYEASGDNEAFVIKGLLESDGIWCSLESDVPHSVFPLDVDGLGAVRLMVSEEDAERAAKLISSYREKHAE